jgi:hypothetical protein
MHARRIVLGVDASNPALATALLLLLTMTFPAANVRLARALYRRGTGWAGTQPCPPELQALGGRILDHSPKDQKEDQ